MVWGKPPVYQGASALATFYALHTAIALANSTDPSLLKMQLDRIYQTSFFGLISMSHVGNNRDKPMITVQYQMGELEVVTPLSAAEKGCRNGKNENSTQAMLKVQRK